ncbi:MAG: 30S ribosomal protein S12 methylthiotransferase RimO [Proteobacteria bacterium]|nr:30S ribosomal protein S12 methylthiotransferase RimO [Pseudomonadota bacterium]MBU2227692.1 30S ribosomal protein S12 methylthiotransferase RimO [Pseudomonadota bacterium]MBU2260427.1 30S ribosomal protein S12 methylthiotransferase RimO [Pseudomonadota bacterium]
MIAIYDENKQKVHIVSLGCPKNQVDSEVMAAILADGGYAVTDRPEEAAVILINTCAFILPAKEESIEEILRMAAWKRDGGGACTHLVVTGCLPQRYEKDLEGALPEVDLFLGIAEIPNVGRHLDNLLGSSPPGRRRIESPANQPPLRSVVGKPTFLMSAGHRRLISTPTGSAYLKIADGCSNRCSYCAIPAIRGETRSRTIEDIVVEAEILAARGVRELILTAQDTTVYGRDLKGKPTLSRLLQELVGVAGISWVRILYAYPAHLTEELLETIAGEEKVCRYLDIPIQHSDDAVLRAMHRQGDRRLIRDVIDKARQIIPGVALRSSLIVGFPGETSRRFENLLSFIREIRFDHLGVFTYSREEGTAAYALSSRISEREKERRRGVLMEEQARISREINNTLIGTRQEVLVEGNGDLAGYTHFGRCRHQAPEIDGLTHLKGGIPKTGDLVDCRITDADDYDLFAEIC